MEDKGLATLLFHGSKAIIMTFPCYEKHTSCLPVVLVAQFLSFVLELILSVLELIQALVGYWYGK
ncbi:hypothetical protein DMM05_19665 [Salmonella enterica subsp. houtenae]|nr:hypothetical protein [Salmonella enterica subsp. houtenae]